MHSAIQANTTITDTDKATRIDTEIARLWTMYADIPDGYRNFATTLVGRAAWLHVSLDELERRIDQDGYNCEYKNGENQYGTKKNPDVETHISMSKIWAQIMGQLADLLPKEKPASREGAGLKEFAAARPRMPGG